LGFADAQDFRREVLARLDESSEKCSVATPLPSSQLAFLHCALCEGRFNETSDWGVQCSCDVRARHTFGNIGQVKVIVIEAEKNLNMMVGKKSGSGGE